MASPDLKKLETHYEFGKNWASFSDTIDEQSIAFAEEGVSKLLTRDELKGRTFLDIGCGSGIHSLAVSRLGVRQILATDIDPNCIATTRVLLEKFSPGVHCETREVSVFDISPDKLGLWDIVYSWGVLHHTGAMYEALEKAASVVKPGGLFVFALYRRTTRAMDRLWTLEKRWYTKASPAAKRRADSAYGSLFRLRHALTGGGYKKFVTSYKQKRGADHTHDISDWLGGYPYEVISPDEVAALMKRLGFVHVRSIVHPGSIGLFGSGCDEFTYRRVAYGGGDGGAKT